MFDKFEVLMSWKLSWGLSFLLFGVSDGHIFFDFSNYYPYMTFNDKRYQQSLQSVAAESLLCLAGLLFEVPTPWNIEIEYQNKI